MSAIQALRETVARLRGPGGCPWDREQTHQSLAVCLIEECAELLDTIDRLDMEHMREELGDVLLQVVFHAQLAEEKGLFDLEAVAAEINEKLIRRHPHVFGDADLKDTDAVLHRWEEIKAAEKEEKRLRQGHNGGNHNGGGGNGKVQDGHARDAHVADGNSSDESDTPQEQETVMKHLPPGLPALLYAHDVYKQIRKQSLCAPSLPDPAQIDRMRDGMNELVAGQMLFEIAAACRQAKIDPESALRRYARKIREEVESTHAKQPTK